jgi:hypothetical protein
VTGDSDDLFASIAGEVVAPPTLRASVGGRKLVWFVLLVAIAHAITYFLVGALAFATLTHRLYEGADPLFGSYLRTPGEIQLWEHVTAWFLPAQLLRGVLIGLALSPFLPLLRRWSVWRRTVAVAGLYLVIGFWAAAVAAPGNIEGLVYLRPEFTLDVVVLVQPEILVQGAAMSFLVAIGLQRL